MNSESDQTTADRINEAIHQSGYDEGFSYGFEVAIHQLVEILDEEALNRLIVFCMRNTLPEDLDLSEEQEHDLLVRLCELANEAIEEAMQFQTENFPEQ